ncbi:MAG: hypothetical protein ACREEM_24245 [Blastocatellia bacterium]
MWLHSVPTWRLRLRSASSAPLPTTLGGVSVRALDSAKTERLAPLFFVSPAQVNYQMPPGTAVVRG